MRTVGQILKEEREKIFYSLEEVERATKIRKELLQALEEDNFDKLPPPTFIQGFIKSYAKFLKLDSEKLLAVFRREFSEKKNPPEVMESFKNPLDRKRFIFTPTKLIAIVIVGIILTFFVYLMLEYRSLVGAPYLQVNSPLDKATVASERILVSGKADPETKITINNQQINSAADGSFNQEIDLNEGENKIVINASSGPGKSTTIVRSVFLKY